MYRSFTITPGSLPVTQVEVNRVNTSQAKIHSTIEKYLSPSGQLNGNAIAADWFPNEKFDIFISHSHADKDLAIRLAAWLQKELNLRAFVDSGVWGQSDILLKNIDENYCKSQSVTGNFDYDKRNKSTSYVHMLLAMALAKLLHKTEALFFVSTSNSVSPKSVVENHETFSPWLYYEIGMSQLVWRELREHRPREVITKSRSYGAMNESANFMRFPLDLSHMKSLNNIDLATWKTNYLKQLLHENVHALDVLYSLKPL